MYNIQNVKVICITSEDIRLDAEGKRRKQKNWNKRKHRKRTSQRIGRFLQEKLQCGKISSSGRFHNEISEREKEVGKCQKINSGR